MITLNREHPGVLGEACAPHTRTLQRRPYRVVVHGLRHFCQKLPALLGNEQWEICDRSDHTATQLAALLCDLPRCDMVFTWAGRVDMGRFLWGARLLGAHKVVVFWCGSDVLRARNFFEAGKLNPWIARRIHWAASPSLADEVRAMGLSCESVQASFVEQIANPKPLPTRFSVLVFLPKADRAELYGWDRVVSVARELPDMHFRLVGLHPEERVEAPANITVEGWTKDLRPLYEECTVLWRPVRHDAGISFMVLEALSYGRHVLYSYPVPGAIRVRDAVDAKCRLQELRSFHEAGLLGPNHEGREAIATTYSREVVRAELHRRWQQIILS